MKVGVSRGGWGASIAPSSISFTLSIVGRIAGSSWMHQSAIMNLSTIFILIMADRGLIAKTKKILHGCIQNIKAQVRLLEF